MMASKNFGARCATLAILFASVSAGVVDAQQANTPAVGNTTQAANPVPAITARIRSELGVLKPAATAADMEAAIVFALSQSADTIDDQLAALDNIGAGASPTLAEAVRNVRAALLKSRLKRGTGAIGSRGSSFGSSNFSTPIVNVGGGSNYSQ